jgi:hypothetical protein|nr:MAG TPA: hypothetical protein [Siphoviridae sp. ctdzB12]
MEELTLNEVATQIDVEYYNLKGEELHMLLPPGDLIKICNVLHDYTDLLGTCIEEYKDDIDKAVTVANYAIYADRLKRIQTKIEDVLGYSTAKAIEKCRKKAFKNKDNGDIGEDALILASKSRATKKNDKGEKTEEKSIKKESEQISLFDFMK